MATSLYLTSILSFTKYHRLPNHFKYIEAIKQPNLDQLVSYFMQYDRHLKRINIRY